MPAYGVVDDQAGDVGVAADARHDFAVSVDTHSACSRGVEQLLRVVLAFEFDRVLADDVDLSTRAALLRATAAWGP